MGLKLLLILLLLVVRDSRSQKVDSSTKIDGSFFKRTTNANLDKDSIFGNSVQNLSYFVHENKEKGKREKLQGSNPENFGEVNPSQKKGNFCSSCKCRKRKESSIISNDSTILNSRNRHNMPTPLTKKFLSDPRFKEILKSERDLNFLTTWLMNRKQSIAGKPEKSDRKRRKRRRTKLRTVSSNELAHKVTVMNQLRENDLFSVRTKPNLKKSSHEGETRVETRVKRQTQELWIEKNFTGYDDSLNLHAFIVRDEEIPECGGNTASKITNTRYFMCSGVILNSRHILTTASCVHYAHIYEHNIDAALSVLIGAVSKTPYVLRVRRYEMHPLSKYNAEAKDHALHNLAILTLACNIPSDALFMPKFPSKYEDMAHMCCSGSCKLLTVQQTVNNRHKIFLMNAKHIPAAEHYDERSTRNRREVSIFARKMKKDNRKIAAPPVFFTNEPKTKRLKSDIGGLGELSQQIMSEMFRSTHGDEPMPPHANMSEVNKKAVENFIKDISTKAIERVNKILLDEESKTLDSSDTKDTEVGMADEIANNLTNTIMSNLNLSQMTPIDLVSDSLAEPDAKYYNCPPLGSPIIINKTLIGLVAYTCDDLQSWVPWQYVDIARNSEWIMGIIYPKKNLPRSLIPAGVENRIDSSISNHDIYKDFKDYNYKEEADPHVDYKISPDIDNTKERIKNYHEQSLKETNPEDFLRLMNTKYNNGPSSKENPPVKNRIFPQSSDYSLVSENTYSGQSLGDKIDDDESPPTAVNKCFLNDDGTVLCESQSILPRN